MLRGACCAQALAIGDRSDTERIGPLECARDIAQPCPCCSQSALTTAIKSARREFAHRSGSRAGRRGWWREAARTVTTP